MKKRYSIMISLVLSVLAFGSLSSQSFASNQDTGNLIMDVRYTNGDRVVSSGTVLKIYQDSSEEVFTELTKDSFTPSYTAVLPLNHRYQIEVYINDVYASVHYVNFIKSDEHAVINIPTSGGLLLEVKYQDGKPLSGAEVLIKSPTGKKISKYMTDINGDTPRRWLPPTIQEHDHYTAEIIIDEKIQYEYSPIHLFSSKKLDLPITTPWPSAVDSVHIKIHLDVQSDQILDWKKEKIIAVLYDADKKLVSQTSVDSRGETRFSNLGIGIYELHIVFNPGSEHEKILATEELIINEDNPFFDIFDVDLNPTIINPVDEIQIPKVVESVDEPELDITTDYSSSNTDENPIVPEWLCNCVAFRFDDVQNFWLNDVQIQILDTFHEKNAPVTVGIIGNHFGNDEKLTNSLTRLIQDEFDIEIANHGWQHENFADYSKKEQSELLKKSNQALLDTLGISPIVFIPPLNSFNEDTLLAMSENGIKYFSTELDESDAVYQMSGFPIHHFPEGATTGELNKEISLFEGLPHEQTYSDIETSINNYGFAVVTLHPQEFAVVENGSYSNKINQLQIEELKLLIDTVVENKFDIVLISDIDKKSTIVQNNPTMPKWVKENAGWWANKGISDYDFSKDLKHLIMVNDIDMSDPIFGDKNTSKTHIPEWIRNTAGWWNEGLLSDEDFIEGIEYLVKNRILVI